MLYLSDLGNLLWQVRVAQSTKVRLPAFQRLCEMKTLRLDVPTEAHRGYYGNTRPILNDGSLKI